MQTPQPPEPASGNAGSAGSVTADAVLRIQAAVLSQPDFATAAAVFVTRVAETFNFERVSLGLRARAGCRVRALSHGVALDARRALLKTLAAAMDEASDQGASVTVPGADGPLRIAVAAAAVARAGGGAVCVVPLVDDGAAAGAVVLERDVATPWSAVEVVQLEHLVNLIGPVLLLQRAAGASAVARLGAQGARLWQRVTTPGNVLFALGCGGLALALAAALWVPVPYSVSAPARLEGAVQRALVAAADGFIQQVAARPGDLVKAGQVLAVLAQHDLLLERSKRESELAQATNAHGGAFARSDRAQMMVQEAKMAEARAQLQLVEAQLERTQLKAPFDGVVISGDLSQSLGAPTQRGNVLMVVAPVERYRLIVEVDERDINDVRVGVAGRIALAATQGTTLPFRAERIAPLAVSRDGRHFFEVEGRLEAVGSAPLALRPGLQGVARIEAEPRPLAAMALGRAVNWLRLRLWSWGWWGGAP